MVLHKLDFTVSLGILITLFTILVGGAMKWQHFEDELIHETETRLEADRVTRESVVDAHRGIYDQIRQLSDRLQKLIDEEARDHRREQPQPVPSQFTPWRDK